MPTCAGVSDKPSPACSWTANAVATQDVIVSGAISGNSAYPVELQYRFISISIIIFVICNKRLQLQLLRIHVPYVYQHVQK